MALTTLARRNSRRGLLATPVLTPGLPIAVQPTGAYRYMICALRKSGRLGVYRAGPFVDTTGGDN